MDKKELKSHLHECLRREVMKSDKKFSWLRTFHKALKCPHRRFNFWWRIASYMFNTNSYFLRKISKVINRRLVSKYNTEILLHAHIGPGLSITHYISVVITGWVNIGHNFVVRQNTTIGLPNKPSENDPSITIGDNVELGANSCIISNNIVIGNNVTIGAMSFINKDIPDNCTVFIEKTTKMKTKATSYS
jgi:serine acetyltransferase